jgi:hypothetical protein
VTITARSAPSRPSARSQERRPSDL